MPVVCNWIIQDVIFGDRLAEMEAVLRAHDNAVHVLRRASALTPIEQIPFSRDLPTVAMVSLNIARRLGSRPDLIPGPFYRPEVFRVSHYAAHWGEYLLNDGFVLLPWSEFRRRLPAWQDQFGFLGGVFVRPDSGNKTFTGLTIPFDDWDHETRCLEVLSGVTAETLVSISRPRADIDGEWRFWILNGMPVTHSAYSWRDDEDPRDPPLACVKLVNELCQHAWQPDVAYTVDVCMTGDGARLVEINSFSCSGVYQADLCRLSEAAISVATDEWFSMVSPPAQS